MTSEPITDLSLEKIEELEAKARAATRSKWSVDKTPGFTHWIVSGETPIARASSEARAKENQEHIAAFDPPTVLPLCSMARAKIAAEARVRELEADLENAESNAHADFEVMSHNRRAVEDVARKAESRADQAEEQVRFLRKTGPDDFIEAWDRVFAAEHERNVAEARAEHAEQERDRLLAAINWATGAGDSDFGDKIEPGAKRYWWRAELTKRAGVTYDRESGLYALSLPEKGRDDG